MPVSSSSSSQSQDLISKLTSTDPQLKLKALRAIKNQIIGNKTKKLSYINLGIVPPIVQILGSSSSDSSLIVNSAAAIGSFACGVDVGVKAVLDCGAYQYLIQTLSSEDEKIYDYNWARGSFIKLEILGFDYDMERGVVLVKLELGFDYNLVVDAGARALRMIFQSKFAPKYDFVNEKSINFLFSLLNNENENIAELGACIITHSCETSTEQKALCEAGVLQRLTTLLGGSLNQRDASLESLAVILKNNMDTVAKFVTVDSGKVLSAITELTKDRFPRTRLLACICLIGIGQISPCFMEDMRIKTKLVLILVELLEEPDRVGDETPFVLADLVTTKEDLQKIAFDSNALDKLCICLCKSPINPKRTEGILLALAELCSKLEICRSRFLSLQVLNMVTDALKHDLSEVRIAACICIRSVTRSVKSLSAGRFMNEMPVTTLVQLLHDSFITVQVAALGAISNIVVDFTTHKSIFIECGGVTQLVELSKSMDSTLRLNSVWALRNLMFLAGNNFKEGILEELTASTLASLICDPEPPIQEQALALLRNLVDGCGDSINHVFVEDGLVIGAVGRQVWSASESEVCVQGMFALANLAAGSEVHKEVVMHCLLPPQAGGCTQSVIIKFLQANDSRLRTASIWCVVNLSYRGCFDSYSRIERLRTAGIVSQIKTMVNDPCLDVKYRVRTALEQCMACDNST
ncbi:hypothetical protein GIB67_040105 [Kingdonia uniflora]|uniref:Armadillo repeat-containing protein 8 n=1 Tax=Kingdonia uniflora TaxID=39325 RepID=A0A7J7MUI3_9MAGN|nr:hypothetical protein GIB67_040105 [Kingdonia uniflora]